MPGAAAEDEAGLLLPAGPGVLHLRRGPGRQGHVHGERGQEIVELETKVKQAVESREEFRAKYDQVKKDMITLKRQIDNEKEAALTKQANELQELKTMMKNKQA